MQVISFFRVLAVVFALFTACARPAPAGGWEQVSKNPTIPALRRYIFTHPQGDETEVARMHLESRLAQEALASAEIAKLQAFLQEFPNGSHAPQVRRALAAARAKRLQESASSWAFLRFLYLHPNEPESPAVRSRLQEVWWRELSARPAPRELLQYIETFPESPHTPAARELLAETLYQKLGENPPIELLHAFALRHAQTAAGRRAQERLRLWERALVLLQGTEEESLRLVQSGENLPADLLEAAAQAQVEAALWAFDLEKLEAWCASAKNACNAKLPAALASWKKMKPAAREALSKLVKAAGPWRPMAALSSLEIALQVEDLHTVWMAMENLSWRPELRAFSLLLQRAASFEPAVAWPAAAACRQWLARWPGRGRIVAQWEQRRLAAAADLPENAVRLALLNSFLGLPLPLDKIAALPAVEPMTLFTLTLQAETLPQAPWDRLQEEWIAAQKRLRDLFPQNLDAGSFPFARSVARRAWILVWKMERMPGPPPGFSEKVALLKTQLADWETRLATFPGYVRCADNPIPQQAALHRAGQAPAREKLLKNADPHQAAFWKSVLDPPENSPYLPVVP